MIAYSKTWLHHLRIQREAEEAVDKECITRQEQTAVNDRYPVGFYTPNFFIRVGMFILTVVTAAFTFGLFFFIVMTGGGFDLPIGLFLFFSLLSYGALEFFVRQNHHYSSGVDDALLWTTVIFFVSGLACIDNFPMLGYAVLLFLLSGYLSLRFADAVMSAIACLSFLESLFYAWLEVGSIAKLTMPFVVMAAAAALYFWRQWLAKKDKKGFYQHCLVVVKAIALLSFYAAGNYFVVREMGNAMFNLNLKEGEGIPFGWLFWALTVGIPLWYMYRGVQKKDPVFLRMGLLLLAAVVFTIRYYYHVMPLELAMVIGGAIMITVAFFLIRYLQLPRQGFTYKEDKDRSPVNKLQVEALVINQTFSTPQVPEETGTRFGGGSGGGAGAGGSF